jgi:hypothetical protein
MGASYFDIRTLVFIMRTYLVHRLNLSTLSEVLVSYFKYVYRVIHSERLVRKQKYAYGEVRKSRFFIIRPRKALYYQSRLTRTIA